MNIKYNGFYHKYFLFKSHNIRSFCGVFWTTLFALFLYFIALNSAVAVVVFPFPLMLANSSTTRIIP